MTKRIKITPIKERLQSLVKKAFTNPVTKTKDLPALIKGQGDSSTK
jgi:hypothetical protein